MLGGIIGGGTGGGLLGGCCVPVVSGGTPLSCINGGMAGDVGVTLVEGAILGLGVGIVKPADTGSTGSGVGRPGVAAS